MADASQTAASGSALRVTSLDNAFRRRGSDRLTNLPTNLPTSMGDHDGSETYAVCDTLPQDPTPEQVDDLAVRLSGFLEDLWRLHYDGRTDPHQVIIAPVPALGIPIVHRARFDEAQASATMVGPAGNVAAVSWPAERETLCVLHLHISAWRGRTHGSQIVEIDAAARVHGLRCVAPGVIPRDGE